MTKPHVAVVGGRGWLGRAIVRAAHRRGLPLTVVSRTPAPGVVAASATEPQSLARALARADVVVNAAGYRGEDAAAAVATNFKLAATLAQLAIDEGWRLLHVGSAAEYGAGGTRAAGAGAAGVDRVGERIREDRPCTPTSLYGTTKLAGSRAVLRAWAEGADAAVARVFNLAAADLPEDNPLHDLAAQVRAAAASARQDPGRSGSSGRGVDTGNGTHRGNGLPGEGRHIVAVGDPATVRDVSRRSWAAAAVVALATAVRSTDFPVVNVCSGGGVGFGEIAEAMARHLGVDIGVRDLGWSPGGRVVGDPTLLLSLVELPPPSTTDDLVRSMLGPAARVPALAGDPR